MTMAHIVTIGSGDFEQEQSYFPQLERAFVKYLACFLLEEEHSNASTERHAEYIIGVDDDSLLTLYTYCQNLNYRDQTTSVYLFTPVSQDMGQK